jgi:hypothetical protein
MNAVSAAVFWFGFTEVSGLQSGPRLLFGALLIGIAGLTGTLPPSDKK